jgi:hypothetical protein
MKMTIDIENLPNKRRAEIYKEKFSSWKKNSLINEGYFPIFKNFKEKFILKDLSGNAIKLYIYLGYHSKNQTGECWVTIDTIAKYFDKSNRAVSGWIKELEGAQLIKRMQMEKNGVAHTFLTPY